MKRTATIFIFLLLTIMGSAQLSFKTVVPRQPLVAGESFQVQYIIEDGDKTMNVKTPLFSNFRFVAGPNIYFGSVPGTNGSKPLRNAVYTLEATRPGKFIIPGATINVNGKLIRSKDATVEVISKAEALQRSDKENAANFSQYFLRPGEDALAKIKENLFVKMMVDKRTCFVGEPILATFKLYSRLESRSDIVKNPGFYGFTVYDMVNLADKQVTTENVNGKTFDVHTIRKVQLYPLQAGEFTIDAMQIKNKVEFSQSIVNKNGEQELTGVNRKNIIKEGVLDGEDDEPKTEGATEFETEINTEPVTIKVKPIPEKNKPTSFGGATGHFTISSSVVNSVLKKNEGGFLEITINGKGNFIQLSAPAVQWPTGVEGFEPAVKDALDKTKMPLTGTRTFRYPFTCATPGNWQLPSISFSFFDIDSNSFKTITTKPVDVKVSNESKAKPVEEHKTSIAVTSERAARTAGIVVVAVVLVILLYWIFKKKEPEKMIPVQQETAPAGPTVEETLEPAYAVIQEDNNIFYSKLYSILWKFAADHFNLSGSDMSKRSLLIVMKDKLVNDEAAEEFLLLIGKCEIGRFTQAAIDEDKMNLLDHAAGLLNKMNSDLFKQV